MKTTKRESRARRPGSLRRPHIVYGQDSGSERATNMRHFPGRVSPPPETVPNRVTSTTLSPLSHSRKSGPSSSLSSQKKKKYTRNNAEQTNPAVSGVRPQQSTLASDMNFRDNAVLSRHSSSQEDINQVSRQNSLGSILLKKSDGYTYSETTNPTDPNISSISLSRVSSSLDYDLPHPRHDATPVRESQGFTRQIRSIFASLVGSSPPKSDLERQQYTMERKLDRLREVLREKDNFIEQISNDHEKKVQLLQENIRSTLNLQKQEKDVMEGDIQCYKEQAHDQDERIRRMRAEIREIESDKIQIKEKYETLIRQQQEDSFQKMETGRWLPREESKVVGDLDRIKREMRSWAKGTSVKDMSLIQALDEKDLTSLMKDLSSVVLLENDQLPQGLSNPKSPSLLLNALLAHDVYTNLVQKPFFFLRDGPGQDLSRAGTEDMLDKIYHSIQASNQQDAHIWRSQMLRLLLPPLRNGSTDEEKSLHSWTEQMIAKVSERQASEFLASSARFFISNNAPATYSEKLKAIYQEAATISYILWTRRVVMRCQTLQEMNHPTFDPDSPLQVTHTLVSYDEHDDHLRGRPITVIVHPLLQAFGTDEAKDYNKGRVWAKAEVWFYSR